MGRGRRQRKHVGRDLDLELDLDSLDDFETVMGELLAVKVETTADDADATMSDKLETEDEDVHLAARFCRKCQRSGIDHKSVKLHQLCTARCCRFNKNHGTLAANFCKTCRRDGIELTSVEYHRTSVANCCPFNKKRIKNVIETEDKNMQKYHETEKRKPSSAQLMDRPEGNKKRKLNSTKSPKLPPKIKKHKQFSAVLMDLPPEILRQICLCVSDGSTIVNLAVVNRIFANLLGNKDMLFWGEWEKRNKVIAPRWKADKFEMMSNVGYRRSLALFSRKGCELCRKPGIKRVYEMGLRCCPDCYRNSTIPRQAVPLCLQKRIDIDAERNPSLRFIGQYYWRKSVNSYVSETFGLPDLQAYVKTRRRELKKGAQKFRKLIAKHASRTMGDLTPFVRLQFQAFATESYFHRDVGRVIPTPASTGLHKVLKKQPRHAFFEDLREQGVGEVPNEQEIRDFAGSRFKEKVLTLANRLLHWNTRRVHEPFIQYMGVVQLKGDPDRSERHDFTSYKRALRYLNEQLIG
ncbi:uncharacterized protein EV422DRAFT_516286 [Fimicolochytrium jonesii]|uniref:uncharacterized protein n=1 Tax=Fimicolochytrium jonesii TaxID=1396493 RepID=UPI0022FDC4CB|nr:uncharacterized protein EV422DRAFT_516286 [Fimicolochytrium jonesii]KAI8824820.1 hypothetical protein EV422DRAFT_516286 [Fimicolochytrium jonesii]